MSKKRVSAIVSGAGFAASFWQNLDFAVRQRNGSDEDLYRIGTSEGSRLINQFADLIMGAKLVTVREWKMWRKITIGTHSGLPALIWEVQQTLQIKKESRTHFILDRLAQQDSFSLASSPQELDLVVTTVRSLDLCDTYSSYASICTRAQELGLTLCPPETALHLCLQHNWEPWLEDMYIGSELLGDDANSYPKYLFQLTRDSEKGSRGICLREQSYSSNIFSGHTPFVFVCNGLVS